MEERIREYGMKRIINGQELTLIRIREVEFFSGMVALNQNFPDPKINKLEIEEKYFNVPGSVEEFYAMVRKNKKIVNAFKKGIPVTGLDGKKYIVTEQFDISQGEFRKLLWE